MREITSFQEGRDGWATKKSSNYWKETDNNYNSFCSFKGWSIQSPQESHLHSLSEETRRLKKRVYPFRVAEIHGLGKATNPRRILVALVRDFTKCWTPLPKGQRNQSIPLFSPTCSPGWPRVLTHGDADDMCISKKRPTWQTSWLVSISGVESVSWCDSAADEKPVLTGNPKQNNGYALNLSSVNVLFQKIFTVAKITVLYMKSETLKDQT